MAATYLIGLGDLYTDVAADNEGPALWAEEQPEGTGSPGAVVKDQGTDPVYTRKGVKYSAVKAQLVMWVVGANVADALIAALLEGLKPESVEVEGAKTLTFVTGYRRPNEPQRGKNGEFLYRAEIDVDAWIEPVAA